MSSTLPVSNDGGPLHVPESLELERGLRNLVVAGNATNPFHPISFLALEDGILEVRVGDTKYFLTVTEVAVDRSGLPNLGSNS